MTKTSPHRPAAQAKVLAVSGNSSELTELRWRFAGSAWALSTAGTLGEACERLQHHSYPVIICENQLCDGDWKDLIRMAGEFEHFPSVIVISPYADEGLYAEALQSGAFAVLTGGVRQKSIFPTL